MDELIGRFYTKIEKEDENGCWIWGASKNQYGYGQIAFQKKPILAHRLSYIIHKGNISKSCVIRHTCDTPACVNPNHLEIGTQADNMNDMWERKRGNTTIKSRGCHHYLSKLTEEQVKSIRSSNKTVQELSDDYNIKYHAMWNIVHKRTWKHL